MSANCADLHFLNYRRLTFVNVTMPMSVMFCHDWIVRLETQASTPERSGRVRPFRAGGVHIRQVKLAVPDEVGVKAIP